MYNDYFGLDQAPFKITPDTGLFYPGASRGDILNALIYAVTSGEGIVKVVGEVGTGKTMICRMLEERLPKKVDIAYLANPSLSPHEILHAIAMELKLNISADANRLQVMQALQDCLLDRHSRGRRVVVFIEEAQGMPLGTLEEIRLLSNLETKRDKLLQIILFGQPELDQNIEKSEIRQLKERITHSFYLRPLSRGEIREYLYFRLRSVGYKGSEVFKPKAYERIAQASEGLTRRVNILADKALLAAYAEDTHDVSPKHVRAAIRDCQFPVRLRNRWLELGLGVGVLALVASLGTAWVASRDGASTDEFSPGLEGAGAVGAGPSQTFRANPQSPSVPPGTTISTAPRVSTPPTPTTAPQSSGPDSSYPPPNSQSPVSPSPVSPSPVSPSPVSSSSGSSSQIQVPATAAAQEASAVQQSAPKALSDFPPGSARSAGSAGSAGSVGSGGGATNTPKGFAGGETLARLPVLEQRLQATQRWLERANHDHYSIQVLFTDFTHRDDLEDFLRARQRSGEIKDFFVYATQIRDRRWFGVLYREYESLRAAEQGLDQLPTELKSHQPFIRNLRDIGFTG